MRLRKWKSAEHLKTEEDMVLYLEACMEVAGDDAAFIARALGNIASARESAKRELSNSDIKQNAH